MIFEYKDKKYNTSEPNRMQLTDDKGLKQAVIDQWFGDAQKKFTLQDALYELAIVEARSETIIEEVTAGKMTYAATYPEWVLRAFHEHFEDKFIEFEEGYE